MVAALMPDEVEDGFAYGERGPRQRLSYGRGLACMGCGVTNHASNDGRVCERVIWNEHLPETLYLIDAVRATVRGFEEARAQAEVLGLKWDAIDFQARTLRVNAALQRIEGKLQLVEPKTARSRRTLQMPEAVITALRAHRVRQLEEKMLAGERWQDTGLAFTTSIGTPMDARGLIRKFHALLKKAGLPRSRFHDLRHSCASLLLAKHVPARVVMELLGHSQISLTLDTYSHVMPAMLREAADSMDAVFTGKK